MPTDDESKPTRRRVQLNMAAADWQLLDELRQLEGVTLVEAIRRSLATRLRIHHALHPNPDNPRAREPEHLAFVGTVSGTVRTVELL